METIELFSVFARIGLDSRDFNSGIDSASTKGKGFGGIIAGAAKTVAAATAAMGLALVGVGVAAANVGRDIDGSMGAIRAQTGMTTGDTDKLRAAFHRMAMDGGASAQELAAVYASIAVAGNDVAHGINVMEAAMTLANATGNNLSDTAYFLGSYLLKVGKDSSYANKYIDLFAQGIQNTNIGLPDLKNYLFRMTPAFQQFGASGETNIAILTRLYQAGITGANLYSGMGTIMMEVATASGDAGFMIRHFAENVAGLNLETATNEEILFAAARAMAEYEDQTEIAQRVTGVMNQTQQAAWFEFMRLAEEIENDVIPSFHGYGAAARMAAERADVISDALNSMRGSFVFVKDTIWDFIRVPIGNAFEAIATRMRTLAEKYAPLVGKAFGGMVGAFLGVENASLDLFRAIGLLTYRLQNQIPEFALAGINMMIQFGRAIVDSMPILVRHAVKIIPTIADGVLKSIPTMVKAGNAILSSLIMGIIYSLSNLLPVATEVINTLARDMVMAINYSAPRMIRAGRDLLMTLITGVKEAVPVLIDTAREIVPRVAIIIMQAVPMLAGTGTNLVFALTRVTHLPKKCRTIKENNGCQTTWYYQGFYSTKPAVQQILPLAVINKVRNSCLIAGVEEVLPKLLDGIREIVPIIAITITRTLPTLIVAGTNMITAIIGGISSSLAEIIPVAVEMGRNTIAGVQDAFRRSREIGMEFIQGITDGVSVSGQGLFGAVGQLIANVVNGAREAVNQFREVGRNMMSGLQEGINSVARNVADSARNVVNSAVDGVKNVLGIRSPSRVFAEIGEDSGEGYVVGWKNKEKDIYRTLDNIFEDIDKYSAGTPTLGGASGNRSSFGNSATATQAQSGSNRPTQNITLNVKFEDIDQVYKLVQLFDNLAHDDIVYGGVT